MSVDIIGVNKHKVVVFEEFAEYAEKNINYWLDLHPNIDIQSVSQCNVNIGKIVVIILYKE
jgi:hypothetical protein